MELKDTVQLMMSDGWRDRMLAEHLQLTIRLHNLAAFINAANRGEKKYKSERDKFAMKKQYRAMVEYTIALEHRMEYAGIEFKAYEAE